MCFLILCCAVGVSRRLQCSESVIHLTPPGVLGGGMVVGKRCCGIGQHDLAYAWSFHGPQA
jgi:hypothetical protein